MSHSVRHTHSLIYTHTHTRAGTFGGGGARCRAAEGLLIRAHRAVHSLPEGEWNKSGGTEQTAGRETG